MNDARLDYLDSLRGIAALLVVLHHTYQTRPFWPSLVRFSPARFLLNGRASVIFFFVLSGFVLAYGLWRGNQSMKFGTFVSRRIVRIYLPYAAAAFAALIAMAALHPAPLQDAAITFNEMWSAPLTWQAAVEHFGLLGTREAKMLNAPSWSLVYELRLSLLMPLLCLCAVRSARGLAVAAIVIYAVSPILMARMGLGLVPYAASGLMPNIVLTLHFAADFVIGVLLAKAALARSSWLLDMSGTRKIALALTAAGLLLVFRDETAAIGSAFVMILALNSPRLQTALRRPVLLWLGRVSFSLYLTHMIVLQLVVRALHGTMSLHASIVVALLAMLPVTVLFYRCIETPAARWSKRIGRSGITGTSFPRTPLASL